MSEPAAPALVSAPSQGNQPSQQSQSLNQNSSSPAEGQPLSSEAAVDAALDSGEISKQEAKDLKKKFKIKSDGKEEEIELDLGDEDAVRTHLQKSRSFDTRLKEFSGFKNNVDKFIEELKSAPDNVLARLGIDVDDFAEKRIQKKIEEMSKSPEQVEREKMQSELEQLRREKEESAKARETAEQEAAMNKTAAEIEHSIMNAMESSKFIFPKNKKFIGEIAKAMKEAVNKGYHEVTVEDVVPIVEKRYKQELSALFDVLPEEAIEAVLGKNNMERMRKKRLAKMTPPTSKNVGRDTGENILNQSREKENKPKKNYRDFFRS